MIFNENAHKHITDHLKYLEKIYGVIAENPHRRDEILRVYGALVPCDHEGQILTEFERLPGLASRFLATGPAKVGGVIVPSLGYVRLPGLSQSRVDIFSVFEIRPSTVVELTIGEVLVWMSVMRQRCVVCGAPEDGANGLLW